MAEFKYLSWLLTWISLICSCSGRDSIVSIIQTLDKFQEEFLDNKADMIRMEKRIVNVIDVAKTSLRAELKENVRDAVARAMAEILQGESLQDMVKDQIVSEVRHLKKGYHQMKRQWHHVSRSLRDFQDKTNVFHESIQKKGYIRNQENSCDTCILEKYRLEIGLQKCDASTANLKADISRCTTLKDTCQSQMSKLMTNPPNPTPATLNVTSTARTSVSTTTLRPQAAKSRILISPIRSASSQHFRQLNIHSNSLSVYQYHNMKEVTSLAYIANTNKLLIGLRSPDKIVSSTLDTSQRAVLRERVRTYGMAVDEDRDIVFMSTYGPRPSVSRMSTQGKDFTAIIDLTNYASYPKQIALDTRRKRIYGCDNEKLYTVTYDGQDLTTLATGSSVYAVTLDQTAGVLYYSIWGKK